MSTRSVIDRLPPPVVSFFESPRLSEALTVAGIGTAASATAIRRLMDLPGLFAVLATLIVLMGLSFAARRREIELRGLLPLSLLAFLGWTATSIFWSGYQWATFGALIYLAAYTLIGFYIALARDTIQILRALGDVARFVLALSLGLEVFSGIIIDTPIDILGITGGIATGSPIAGIEGSRNLLGMVATLGAVSFVMEWRTRSVSRTTSALSGVLAGIAILLTRSPVTYGVAALVLIAFLVLSGLRRIAPPLRTVAQILALVIATVGLAVVWSFRAPLAAALNAGGELDFRLRLWQQVVVLRDTAPLQGWGWLGRWDTSLPPYSFISSPVDRPAGSASNAYLDVWLQLGIIGLLLFVVLIGLAFVRSWLLSGHRRSIVYAWPALVLVVVLFTGLVESLLLYEIGWLVLVICSVKASQELSWRRALDRE